MLAGIVLAVGLVIGFMSHSVSDEFGDSITCGSPFSPQHAEALGADLGSAAANVATSYDQQCGDALSAPRTVALSIAGVGVLALLFCGLTAAKVEQPATPAP